MNEDTLAYLQGILDAITKSKELPPSGVKRLQFYVKTPGGDSDAELSAVPFTFKTAGGDCRNLVQRQLSV